MANKDRFSENNCESEGSGSSGQVDEEISASENSKCINLNSAAHDGFGIPKELIPFSKLSTTERKNLAIRLKAELEEIRILQKQVELQRTNVVGVSSSSDMLCCSDAQNGPLTKNFWKSSSPTSGRGKNLYHPGHKASGWNRSSNGRFESAELASAPSTSNAFSMNRCELLLKKLMSHQYGWVFSTPVDPVKLDIPDYFSVIKHPMDLGTISTKITSREYSSPWDFLADVRLTFSNAMTYNPPGNQVHFMADSLSKFFELRWKFIERKLPPNDSLLLPEKSGIHEETAEMVNPGPSTNRVMTYEEKLSLSRELEALLGELPDNIEDFLIQHSSNGRVTREGMIAIEIDVDDLSDDILFMLRMLLDGYLQENQKNHEKADICEIELPIESGLSYSSMQLCKGNDPIGDDDDIGGNEPHVSSYSPVEMEKGSGCRSNKCTSSGSSSGDSESISGVDQLEEISPQKRNSVESDSNEDGESVPTESQVSPQKIYRTALLKNRFADIILKAQEKTHTQGENGDPEKLSLEREELEIQRKKEKAQLQEEAKAAEDARKRAKAEAAAESKRKRDLETEAARQPLQKMEKTVEMNENSRFLEDLEMLSTASPKQLPSSGDETSPEHSQCGLGSFKFSNSNSSEQLALYMKADEEEEEPSAPNTGNDVEEGETD